MDFAYPFFPVQFTKHGAVFAPAEVDALMSIITTAENAPTDLLLLSHGWNNNMDEAKSLYSELAAVIKPQIDANPVLKERRFVICGVLWPSKKFEDKDLIPAGAASLDEAVTADDLKRKIHDFRSLYAAAEWPSADEAAPADFDEIEKLMDTISDDPADQEQAVNLIRNLLPKDAASSDDASDVLFDTKTSVVINKVSKRLNPPAVPAGNGAAAIDPFRSVAESGLGGAAGFRDVLGGIKAGFLHLLNYATYYMMKARAGTVGVQGLSPLVQKLRGSRPNLRIHMIGHSFGCRAVAAAINALPENENSLADTVLLLQGAFSHNGFANATDNVDRGAFRDVVEKQKVRGPILITHTRNDQAVGIAYPIASRINGVTAASLGDANDKFGGLGSNGAQTKDSTPERVSGLLLPVGGEYPFAGSVDPSTPFNLKSDDFIKNHSDIKHPAVGFALAVAMSTKYDPLTAGQIKTLRHLLGDQWSSEARDGFLVVGGRFIDETGTDRTGELENIFQTVLPSGRHALRCSLEALLSFVGSLPQFARDYEVRINDPTLGSTPIFPQLPVMEIEYITPFLYRVFHSEAKVHGTNDKTKDYIMRNGKLPNFSPPPGLILRAKPKMYWCSYDRYESPSQSRSALQILDEWGSDCKLRATLPTSCPEIACYVAFSGVTKYPPDVINRSGNEAFAGYNVEIKATDHPELTGGGLQIGVVGEPRVSALEEWSDAENRWITVWTSRTPGTPG